MADKQFGIIVTGDISDIESKLSDLADTLAGFVDKMVNISITVDDSQVETLEQDIQALDGQTLQETVDVEASELDSVEADLEALDGQVLQETVQVDEQGVEDAKVHLEEMGTAGENASNQIQTAMPPAVKSVEEVGDKAEEAAKKTEEIGNKSQESGIAADIGMGAAALAVLGLISVLDDAIDRVRDLNIYFEKVGSTSVPEEEWRDLFAEMSNPNFPVDEVKAYMTLFKQMGLTDVGGLKKATKEFNDIRIAVGTNTETMKKFGSSVKVLNIDLNDLPSTFNAIAYAQANVIGGFEAYVQWMTKYDATFAEMGLNIDQTAVIIAAATKKWGGGRAAYQGLNKAIQESGGNLDVLEEKLGLHNDELSHATDLTGKYSGRIEKNSQIVRDNVKTSEKLADVQSDLDVLYGDLIADVMDFGYALLWLGGIPGLIIPSLLKWFDVISGKDFTTKYWKYWGKIGDGIKDFGSNVGKTIKGWMGWGDDAGRAAYNVGTQIEGKIEKPSIWTKLKDFGSRVRGVITRDWAIWGDDAGRVTFDMVKGMDGTWTTKSPGFLEKIARFGQRIPSVLDDAIRGVGFKLPAAEGLGAGIGSTILKGLSKLAIPLTIAQMLGEGIYNFEENLKKSPLDVILDTYWLRPLYELAVPEPVRKFIDDLNSYLAPENMGPAVFGPGYTEMANWIDTNVSKPFRDWVDNLWPSLVSSLEGIAKIDLVGMIFGTGEEGAGVDPFAGIRASWDGFLAWLGTVPGQITGFFANLPENLGRLVGDAIILVLENLYYFLETLIALPGQFSEAVNTAWGTVTKTFTDFADFIWNLPGQVYNSLVDLGNQIVAGLAAVPAQAQAGLDGITQKFWDFVNWLTTLPGQVWTWVTKTFNDMVNYIYSIPDQVKAGLDSIIQKFWDFIHWIESLPRKLWKAITDAWDGFIRGLKEKFPDIEYWLQKIRDLFPHSPPKTGPLIDIMDWGGNMADAIQSGIDKKFPGLVSSFAGKMQELRDMGTGLSADIGDLSGFSMSRSTMAAVSAPMSNEITINVSLEGANINSELDAKKVGQAVGTAAGDSLADRLKGQASNRGFSPINNRR